MFYQSKEWLEEQYLIKQKGIDYIGKEFNIAPNTVRYWLRKHKIKIRELSYACHLRQRNTVELTEEAKEFIYGELLGDMNISATSKYAALIQYSSKHKSYIKWLIKILKGFGIKQAGKIHYGFRNNGHTYSYSSCAYPELLEIQKKFYKDRVKIVPKDLIITSLILRQWFIGDGNNRKHCGIILATCSFKKIECLSLIKKLNDVGLYSNYVPSINGIYIKEKSKKDFFNYIGNCPSEIKNIYGYKWKYS